MAPSPRFACFAVLSVLYAATARSGTSVYAPPECVVYLCGAGRVLLLCVCVCAPVSETQNFESFLLFVTSVPASGAGFCCDSFAMWMQASVLCVSYARPRTGGHCPSIALARAYAHPHRGCIFVCAVALGGAARDEDACCRTCVPWLNFDLDQFVVLLPLSRVVTAQLRDPFVLLCMAMRL